MRNGLSVLVLCLGLCLPVSAQTTTRKVAVILTATADGGSGYVNAGGIQPFKTNFWGTPQAIRDRIVTLGEWLSDISYGKEKIGTITLYGLKTGQTVTDFYPVTAAQGFSYTAEDGKARAGQDGYRSQDFDVTIVLRPVMEDSSYGGATIWLDGWLHLYIHWLRFYGMYDSSINNQYIPTNLAVMHPAQHPRFDHKMQQGWLTQAQRQTISTTQSGTFTLTPIETATGIKQLNVQQPDSSFIQFELRKPDKWEITHAPAFLIMTNGVLIDATPSTPGNLNDPLLVLTEKFYDAPKRMLYEFVGMTGDDASLKITRNADPPASSGNCQQGQSVTAADGATWSIGPKGSPPYDVGNIFRNGIQQAGQGKQLLSRDGIYTEGYDVRWFKWTGTTWTEVVTPVQCGTTTPPPPTNEELCAAVPSGQVSQTMTKTGTVFEFTFLNNCVVVGAPRSTAR